jgi:hypothetical protein
MPQSGNNALPFERIFFESDYFYSAGTNTLPRISSFLHLDNVDRKYFLGLGSLFLMGLRQITACAPVGCF